MSSRNIFSRRRALEKCIIDANAFVHMKQILSFILYYISNFFVFELNKVRGRLTCK